LGLLALDVSQFGVVMSADSQPVELLDGRHQVIVQPGQLHRDPIIVRRGGGFSGLVGYVGRERIDGTPTRSWLEKFSTRHPTDALPDFCGALAFELTRQWQRQRFKSALILFVSGVEAREARFWFVHNTQGLYDPAWTYIRPTQTFQAIDDLDGNYVAGDLLPGQTKEQLLRTRMYFFRNGVLRPSASIFDAFSGIIGSIYAQRVRGFAPIASLDDLAFFDRQRMEFTKRLYSSKHGIATLKRSPINGTVHVRSVARDGTIKEYGKLRSQIKTL
jgi:hypothetical protein